MNIIDREGYGPLLTCSASDAIGAPVRIVSPGVVTTADASNNDNSAVIGFIISKPTSTTCLIRDTYYYSAASGFSGFSGTQGSSNGVGSPVYLTNTSGFSGSPGTNHKIVGESFSPREAILKADPITAMIPNTTSGFKNKLINGAFDVWQYGTASVATGATGKPDRADRYIVYHDSNGTVNHVQATPSLLTHAVTGTKVSYASQLTVATADTNLTGDQRLCMYQIIEGYTARTIGFAGFTFSFWMYGNQGTYSAFAGDNTYYNVQTFVLPNNTWTRIKITFPPNANYAGSNTNGVGMVVGVTLALGTSSSYATSSNLGSWVSGTKLGTTTQTNGLASNTNIFYTSLWQVEEGPVATKFEERPYGIELALCQRYCYTVQGSDGYYPPCSGYRYGTASFEAWFRSPVPMRVTPTSATDNVTGFNASAPSGTNISIVLGETGNYATGTFSDFAIAGYSPQAMYIYFAGGTLSGNAGGAAYVLIGPDVKLIWSAEL